jgi:hypothetical protein
MECATGVCPECKSRNRVIFDNEQITILESAARAKKRTALGVKPHEEIRDEVRWNGERNRLERRVMVIDRSGDRYSQEWSDLETGEVAFTKSGRLSDPDMHGESARRPSSSA